MRPQSNAWITRLHGAILTCLVLVSLSDGGDAECVPEIRVHRNTVLNGTAGRELRIDCPFVFCQNSPPSVSWCRVNELTSKCVPLNGTNHKTEWTDYGNNSGMSHLHFKLLSINDSGLYQCEMNNGTTKSHYITISLSDLEVTTCTDQENLTTSKPGGHMENPLQMYVYLSAGILGLVLFVITISFLALRGCRGSRKPGKELQQENQYIAIPLTPQQSPRTRPRPQGPQPRPQGPQPRPQGPQPLPEVSPRPLPRQATPTPLPDNIYDNAFLKQPARRQATPPHPSATQGSAGEDFGNRKAGERREGRRDRAREEEDAEEEESPLVYAALNHQLFPRNAARLPRLPQEETSEYAAIRLA